MAFYDTDCPLCRGLAARLDPTRVTAVPLQDVAAVKAAGLEPEEVTRSLHVVAEGEVYSGAEAVVRLFAASYPRLAWLARLYRLPGVARLAEALYGWVSRHRHWFSGMEKVLSRRWRSPMQPRPDRAR